MYLEKLFKVYIFLFLMPLFDISIQCFTHVPQYCKVCELKYLYFGDFSKQILIYVIN